MANGLAAKRESAARVHFDRSAQCGILLDIMRNTLIITVFFCTFLPGQGQSKPAPKSAQTTQGVPATEEQVQTRLNQTAAATVRWEENTSPGLTANVQLIKKDQVNGKPVMEYRLKVTGAPRNKLYKLMAWPITFPDPVKMMEGLAIAADGTVGCPKDSTKSCAQLIKGTELKLTYSPGLGEIFRHALVSEDGRSNIFFSLVPAPMTENDKSCSLEVVELEPGFGLAIVRGKGFTPGEQVALHTQSYQEVHDQQPKANPQGEFWATLSPWVKGRTMGTTQVSVKGRACAPALSFEWGSE